jgi:hypothetical protein
MAFYLHLSCSICLSEKIKVMGYGHQSLKFPLHLGCFLSIDHWNVYFTYSYLNPQRRCVTQLSIYLGHFNIFNIFQNILKWAESGSQSLLPQLLQQNQRQLAIASYVYIYIVCDYVDNLN